MKDNKLVRGLGLIGLVASTFNCTVGGGIFRLPGSVYQLVGSASLIVYFVCFIVMLLVVSVFIQIGRTIETSGGPYAYVRPTLGAFPGFLVGVLLWCLATFAMASVSVAYANFLGGVIPIFSSPVGQACGLGLTFFAMAFFNIRGVKQGANLSLGIAAAKLIPLFAIIVFGVAYLEPARITPSGPIDVGGISRAAMVLIFAFTGVESALIPSGEIQNPRKNLPRALLIGLFLVLFLYVMVHAVSQSVLGDDLSRFAASPLTAVGERLMGTPGRVLLSWGAVLSTAGYLSAMVLSLPRSLLAFSEDGFLPKVFAKVDPKTHAPKVAIITQVAFVWLFAVSGTFEKLAVIANLSAILMYMMCAVAALMVLRRNQSKPVAFLIPCFAMLAMAFLLKSVTMIEWLSVLGTVALSSLLYIFRRKSI